jgi:3-oxoacyl-[acyl-carrier protein] reductase
MSEEDWQEVIQTNLCGTINMSRALITLMMKQKSGCIINMSSVSGAIGLARQTNYSASKAGIIGFTKALAKEVGRQNIRVNAVCPGFIETDMVAGLSEKLKSEILKYIPQQRLGSADEVAQLCVFLASEEAGYITGQAVKIDGGMAI